MTTVPFARRRSPWLLLGLAVAAAGAGCTNRGLLLLRPPDENRSADLVEQVRARLPSLHRGMSEAQVNDVLSDLPLGEGKLVDRTISGGKSVEYELPAARHLRLVYIPVGYGPEHGEDAGPLYSASLTDY